jgi:hypothetical protein
MTRALFIFSALFALGCAHAARSACLLGNYSVSAEFERSAAVVIAKAISERRVLLRDGFYGPTIYRVALLENFKGRVSERARIYSENDSGRFPMGVGSPYLLFLYRAGGHLHADPCGNSARLEKATKTLAILESFAGARH